ncbi:hypothetical protein [Brevibacterium marinum]|uniref:Uncharacterized protein n=1 Tax=Brevibacterium marinum TaxID=418643 RepID=A0A846S6G7_9MICO|nr:hypothetical protein [Brevibacterium marinum]NJC58643.1 hypothetical protein [Brevibacterium marinum]
MITEELASASTTTHHVTAPVMPPNPIRRDTEPEPEVLAEPGTFAESEAPPETTLQDIDKKGKAEKKEKSDSRVSATQLLAGAAAAATSSVIGGQLGVAGTVVGAGVASIITGLAVTLYTSSLDKGKEKIREVGTKLAPAVRAKSFAAKTQRSAVVAAGQTESTFGSLSDKSADASADGQATTVGDEPKSWWQKLRRKRVLYPVTIGVATFGIGLGAVVLGAVVMAESLTDADISPGTSQISRSVSGQSGAGHDSGTSQDGGSTADPGSSGADPHPVQNPNQGSGNEDSTTSEAQSTSANEGSSTTSSSADQTGTDQGADSSSSAATSDDTAGAGSGSSGSSSSAADTSGGGAASSGGSLSSGSQDGVGSSDSGSSSADSGAGGGSGSISAGSGSDATAEG